MGSRHEGASIAGAAWTLARTALSVLSSRAALGSLILDTLEDRHHARIAALVHALVVVVAAVALLASLDDLVAAERAR